MARLGAPSAVQVPGLVFFWGGGGLQGFNGVVVGFFGVVFGGGACFCHFGWLGGMWWGFVLVRHHVLMVVFWEGAGLGWEKGVGQVGCCWENVLFFFLVVVCVFFCFASSSLSSSLLQASLCILLPA